MQVSNEVAQTIATVLQEKFGFATKTELDKAVADILQKTEQRTSRGGNQISLSRLIRGMKAERHEPINRATVEEDVAYARALSTGSTPGSYLVPTMQADEVIQMLTTGGILRASGARIWPMNGVQKLNIPQALTSPAWVWMAQNSVQQATDPNLSQVSFDLKERRALIAIPNQLIATSVPAFDTLIAQLIGLAAAEHEDTAFFASSTVSGGPACIATASGITSLNAAGGNANGGALTYQDILAVLAKAAAVKAKPPFAWYMSPRTFYQRVLGMIDTTSRPIVVPTATQGLYPSVQFSLMGWPVFVTPFILENEAVGSGSSQSHIIFSNPSYLHIAQDDSIAMAVSTERYFDVNQTAIRATQHLDGAVSPAAGVVILFGVN
jgi:HK97 family phage major capsid protein